MAPRLVLVAALCAGAWARECKFEVYNDGHFDDLAECTSLNLGARTTPSCVTPNVA